MNMSFISDRVARWTVCSLAICLGGCSFTNNWWQDMDAGQKAYDNGDFAQSEASFMKACTDKDALAKDEKNHAQSLQKLGDAYVAQQKNDQAIDAYGQCLEIRQKVMPANSIEVGNTLQALGEAYLQKHQYSDAEENLGQALTIKEKFLSANDPDYAKLLNDIGRVSLFQGDYESCEKNLQQALAIYAHNGGRHIDDRLNVLQNLADLYQTREDLDKLAEIQHQMNGLSALRAKEAFKLSPLLGGSK